MNKGRRLPPAPHNIGASIAPRSPIRRNGNSRTGCPQFNGFSFCALSFSPNRLLPGHRSTSTGERSLKWITTSTPSPKATAITKCTSAHACTCRIFHTVDTWGTSQPIKRRCERRGSTISGQTAASTAVPGFTCISPMAVGTETMSFRPYSPPAAPCNNSR